MSHAPGRIVLLNELFHHNLSVSHLWFTFLNCDQNPDNGGDPQKDRETEEVEGIGVGGKLFRFPGEEGTVLEI